VGPERLGICHVVAPAPSGGLEAVVAALAAGMARRGHRVRILALLDPGGTSDALAPAVRAGVELVEIRLPPRSYRNEARRVAEQLASASPAIAHTHGYHADLVGDRSARAVGAPTVSTVHGFTGGSWRNRLYEWLDRRALRRFDAVVAVSRAIADTLTAGRVAPGALHLIPNAFAETDPPLDRAAARRKLGLPPDRLVAGWVGRLSPEKGPDLFLEALARAPGWHAAVVGSGPLQAWLRDLAGLLSVQDRVSWHGTIPGAAQLLKAFDVLVLSSRTEGTPIVLLEAMAAGVPALVTRVGGVPDVVSEREALVVPAGDPAALARALEQVRTRPDAAATRARAAARRVAEAFAIEPWLDRYETVYRSVGRELG